MTSTTAAWWTTYVIDGPAGSGVVGINGAAARLIAPGDLVIIIGYAVLDEQEARTARPRVVFVDERNRLVSLDSNPAAVPDVPELPEAGELLPGNRVYSGAAR